jgi:hypothetical protein
MHQRMRKAARDIPKKKKIYKKRIYEKRRASRRLAGMPPEFRMLGAVYQPPQPFSLNDILRRHCRDRLYVQPLYWTAQHVQLLDCRFIHRESTLQPASSTPSSEGEQSREDPKVDKHPPKDEKDADLERAARRLACGTSATYQTSGLVDLLHAISKDPIDILLPYVSLNPLLIPLTQKSAPNPSQRPSRLLLCG